MTKVDVFSGFLGAGKTTLIKKLIAEAYQGEKLVLIENEFGEVGVDGGFMKESGIEVTEMSQGCICCTLVGDFAEALVKVLDTYAPDRILIEPSGVGKLSDVIRAVQSVNNPDLVLNSFTAVVDAKKCRIYMKNFGEFYNDQVEHASCIVLSRTQDMTQPKLDACVALLREKNTTATIVTTDWNSIAGAKILEAMEQKNTLEAELERLSQMTFEDHVHDDDDDDDEECECGHHHHHDHDHEHEHEHEHEHDHEHEHGHHHHHHHHGHDADEIFVSFGAETSRKFTQEEIEDALGELSDAVRFGVVLRAKGIVEAQDGTWIHFDYVPGETDIRRGPAEVTGRLCVIGSQINEEEVREVFGL